MVHIQQTVAYGDQEPRNLDDDDWEPCNPNDDPPYADQQTTACGPPLYGDRLVVPI